jgi:hypothetical protein
MDDKPTYSGISTQKAPFCAGRSGFMRYRTRESIPILLFGSAGESLVRTSPDILQLPWIPVILGDNFFCLFVDFELNGR